jgi:2-keto-4-pentenoate hydratase
MTTDRVRRAADLLLAARRSGRPLDALPAELIPADAESAYAVQHRVTEELGAIGGWKTAPAKDGVAFDWAPIPASGVFADNAEIALADFPRAALELEIGLVLGSDLPSRAEPYHLDEISAAIVEMRVCLELFGSRFADPAERAPLERLADAQNAAGVVVGTGPANWRDIDLAAADLSFDYAGERYTAQGGHALLPLLAACTALANGAGALGGLRAGQVVITGARIGPIPALSVGPARGVIHPVGAVRATFI